MSRKTATKIALRVLQPQKADATNGVVVLGLARPLGPKDFVTDAKAGTYKVKPLGRKAWLFWEDLEYSLNFTHDSRMVLVDDKTGKVLKKQSLLFWPLVDGKRPAFFTGRAQRNAGRDKSFRVYEKLPAANAAATRRTPFADPLSPPTLAHASNTFADTCLVMAGNFEEFGSDFDNMDKFWQSHGVPPATRMPNTSDLGTTISGLPASCKDVIIFLDGHEGSEGGIIAGKKVTKQKELTGKILPDGKHEFRTVEKVEDAIIPLVSVRNAIKANPKRTFKVVVDACYSGLFINDLKTANLPNVLVAVTSSASNQKSWGLTTGGFTNGFITGMTEAEPDVTADKSGADPAARKIEQGAKHPHGVLSGRWVSLTNLPPMTTTPPTHALNVSASPADGGSVSGNGPSGCPPGCPAGTAVTLTATPASGYTFTGWTVDGSTSTCSGTGTCTITMDADHTVVATFTKQMPQSHCSVSAVRTSNNFDVDVHVQCDQDFTEFDFILPNTNQIGGAFGPSGWTCSVVTSPSTGKPNQQNCTTNGQGKGNTPYVDQAGTVSPQAAAGDPVKWFVDFLGGGGEQGDITMP